MDKFICKHCNFSLVIKKVSTNVIVKITTPTEFINATKVEEVQEYDVILEKSTLEGYFVKKGIKEDEQERLLELYNQMVSQKRTLQKYILKCSTCGSEYPLEPETNIYSLNFKKVYNDDNIELKLYDPTLPRTKDYICVNKECETNKKGFNTANKEAVFYRIDSSYHMKYACLNCKTSWSI